MTFKLILNMMRMKKLLLLAIAQFVSVFAFSQDLTGTWKFENKDSDTIMSEVDTYKSNGQMDGVAYTKFIVGTTKDGEEVSMSMTIKYKASWQCKNNILTQIYDADSITIPSSECSEKFPKWLFKIIVSKAEKEFKKEAKSPQTYKIQSLSDSEMVLVELNTKDPETEKYVRVK